MKQHTEVPYHSLRDAAFSVLRRLSDMIDINTVYIAQKSGNTNVIQYVYNKDKVLLEEGYSRSFDNSYCQFIESNDRKPFIVENFKTHMLTKNLPVTEEFGEGALIGVPILVQGEQTYGTLCAMDDKPRGFSQKEIELFDMMGRLFGYVADVDIEKERVETAVVPLVQLGEGIVILPLTGTVNKARAQVILDHILSYCAENSTDYVILDISGLAKDEKAMTERLLYLMSCLKLAGAGAVITGVRPDQAVTLHEQQLPMSGLIIKSTVEEALRWIGITFSRDTSNNEGQNILEKLIK